MAKPRTDPQTKLFSARHQFKDLIREGRAEKAVLEDLAPRLKEEDFAAMYKEGGRPPASPRILALTTVLQTLDNLPDRDGLRTTWHRRRKGARRLPA